MPRKKGTHALTIDVYGDQYSVRVTKHGWDQMESRQVSIGAVGETISKIGKCRLASLRKMDTDVAVVNLEKGFTVVFGWDGNKIMVVTVIDTVGVFTKRNTLLITV